MRAYHVAIPLALLFWQAAPAPNVPPRAGLVRLGLAYATGDWEDYQKAQFGCDGRQTSPEHSAVAESRSLAGRADILVDRAGSRVTFVVGRVTSDSPFLPHGLFLGGLLVMEAPGAGFGIGVRGWSSRADQASYRPYPSSAASLRPPESVFAELSALLRIGPQAGPHFRAEYHPVDETPALSGEIRTGIGFGQGPGRQLGGFLGVEVGPKGAPSGGNGLAFFSDLSIPFPSGVDLLVRGFYGPGHLAHHWGVGAGLRVALKQRGR